MDDACQDFCESFVTDLVNKILIKTNFIKLFHSKIYIILAGGRKYEKLEH